MLKHWIKRTLEKIDRWLIAPSPALTRPDQRRQARLLATLLIQIVGLTLVTEMVALLFPPSGPYTDFNVLVLAGGVLVIAYGLSRTRHYHRAVALVLGVVVVGVFAAAISQTGSIHLDFLVYLIVPVLLSSMFLSLQATFFVFALVGLGLVGVPLLMPDLSLQDVVVGPFSFYVLVCGLVLLAAYHRNQLERDRRLELAQSKERYRSILTVASDYFYSLGVQSNGTIDVGWIGGAFQEITGYSPQVIADMDAWLSIVDPNDLPGLKDSVQACLANRASVTEYRIRTATGEERWLQDSARPVWAEAENRVVSVIGAVRDITENKRAEAALLQAMSESEQRSQEVLALLRASRAVLRHRQFEEAARNIFDLCKNLIGAIAGYVALLTPDGSENEVLFLDSGGRPCTVDPDLPMPIRGLRAQAYRTGQPAYHNDFYHSQWVDFMPEGHVRLDNVLFAPLVIENKVDGLLGLANKPGGFTPDDVRVASAFGELAAVALVDSRALESLEHSQEQLRRYAGELERSNQALEQFAYAVSHDLREPLRTVTGYLQLLERRCRGKLDADADEFIQFALNGAGRLGDMIGGLLDLARVNTRGKELVPTDCETVLGQVLRDLRFLIEEHGAVVTHDPLPTVRADGTQLSQVFQNLISNAIKFHPSTNSGQGGQEPPQVHLWAEPQAHQWILAVRDNGIGIDPAQSERAFQIFQRLHPRDEYDGTGIGLALCKKIVERHGGRIWVESQPGQGATFYFTLPQV